MTDHQIDIAANAVAGLIDATRCDADFILSFLEGCVVSEEEASQIKERIASS